jgi:signal transduction histidine kinase
MWPTVTIPIIHVYSLKTQLTILSVLLLISYLHRKSRFLIAFLITAYFLFKTIVPLARWAWIFFKAVAWFGFYIHHFQSGIGFVLSGVGFVLGTAVLSWNKGLEWLAGWMERMKREREAERERKREAELQRERERAWEAERGREREEMKRGGDGAGDARGGKKGKKNRR